MLPDDEHGGDLGAHPGVRLDFSVSLNPLGIPDAVRSALAEAMAAPPAYPDPHSRTLREALAVRHGMSADAIVCGNGAADLIYRVCDALRPAHVLVTAPTFTEYERCAQLFDAKVTRYPLYRNRDFDLDVGFLDAVDARTDLVFCCQPNNPTGRLVDAGLLEQLVRRVHQIGATLVVDECFLPFTDAASMIAVTATNQNLIVLRALTKTYALAGVRLGYAVCGDASVAGAIAEHGPRWNVSAPAQAAGLAVRDLSGWDDATRAAVRTERDWVTARLHALGYEVVPSHANFMLFQCQANLADALLGRGILIRSCAGFAGLDRTWWRIGLRRHADNATLIDALTEVLHA